MSLIHSTYQRRGYLSKSGYAKLDYILAECAKLYNAGLQMWKEAYSVHIGYKPARDDDGNHRTSRDGTRLLWNEVRQKRNNPGDTRTHTLFRELTAIRKELTEWAALDTTISRGVLLRLDRARNAFYRRCQKGENPGYPRFKSGKRWRTIELSEARPGMVKNGKVKIKGLPTIDIKDAGLPPSTNLKSLKITRIGRRVTVNMTYTEKREPLPVSIQAVGIDAGITDRLMLSTGERIPKRIIDRDNVTRKQRRKDNCQHGSNTRKKRIRILANAQYKEKIRNRNECHQITTNIVRRFGHIAVEALGIQNMSKSAKGNLKQSGKNIRAKTKLNRNILEQTWGLIREQIRYKAEWAGREFVEVDPKFTSQMCHQCGKKGNREGKLFICSICHWNGDADYNAALNILHKSLAGGNSPPLVTRPAEI